MKQDIDKESGVHQDTSRPMKYDVLSKRLFEIAGSGILRHFNLIGEGKVSILPLPQELFKVIRTDVPLLLQKDNNQDELFLVEIQHTLTEDKKRDLHLYHALYKNKFGKKIRTIVFHLSKRKVEAFYQDESVLFNFELVQLSELDVEAELYRANAAIAPFLSLMKNAHKKMDEIKNIVYSESNYDEETKADILTAVLHFASIRDRKLATNLRQKWRSIVTTSPFLEEVMLEGELIGQRKGELKRAMETARRMVELGATIDFIMKATDLTEEQLREAHLI